MGMEVMGTARDGNRGDGDEVGMGTTVMGTWWGWEQEPWGWSGMGIIYCFHEVVYITCQACQLLPDK